MKRLITRVPDSLRPCFAPVFSKSPQSATVRPRSRIRFTYSIWRKHSPTQNRPSSDDGTLLDVDSGQNRRVATDEDVFIYCDVSRDRGHLVPFLASRPVVRVARVHLDIWSNDCPWSDFDFRTIFETAIGSDSDLFVENNIPTVVARKLALDANISGYLTNFERLFAFDPLRRHNDFS